MGWLSFAIGVPILTGALFLVIPGRYRVLFRLLSLLAVFLSACAVGHVFFHYKGGVAGIQFAESASWIPWLGSQYLLGVNGISVSLFLLTGIVGFCAVAMAREITEREKEFYMLLLWMYAGVLGAYAARDLLLFFVFHELALVPTFLGVALWGFGKERRRVAFTMVLYLGLGSLLLLIGLLWLYLAVGLPTMDIDVLRRHLQSHPLDPKLQKQIYLLLLLGFGILVGLWPFHSWAPAGYAAAPTPIALLHAGALKSFGLYGLLRIAMPLLPAGAQYWQRLTLLLAAGNLIYCSLAAMRQKDLGHLLGFAAVAHAGFGFLGLASGTMMGWIGAVVLMIAYGLFSTAAFAVNGYLRQRLGAVGWDQLGGGLFRPMPFVGTIGVMAFLAGIGLPGFAGFPGEVMVVASVWRTDQVLAAVAVFGGLVLGAVYLMRAARRIWFGPSKIQEGPERWDVRNPWHRFGYLLPVCFLLLFGLWPKGITTRAHQELAAWTDAKPSITIQKSDPALSKTDFTQTKP